MDEAKTFVALLKKATGLDDGPRYMINIMVENAIKKANSKLQQYGPNLVWASQMPAHEFKPTIEEAAPAIPVEALDH